MYNRAPRFSKFKTFNRNLGPNTYVVCEDSNKNVNVVPFLSTADRFKKINPATSSIYLPEIKGHIKGGSSVRNRAERFQTELSPKIKDIPDKGQLTLCKEQKKGYLCKPSLNTNKTVSIPTKNYLEGYKIDIKGNIKPRISKCSIGTTLGPTHYHVNYDLCCEQYKGCKWSRRTSERRTYEILEGPGPADYEVIDSCYNQHHQDLEEYREMARRLCYLPRFSEQQILRTIRENLPGPGYYECEKSFGCKSIYDPKKKRPFISATPRLAVVKTEGPSPTTYNSSIEKTVLVHTAPFGVQSERTFQTLIETPGPATYTIKGDLQQKIDLAQSQNPFSRVSFNNTAKRFQENKFLTPSPMDYNKTNIDVRKCRNRRRSSVFKSRVRRFNDVCLKHYPIYDVVKAFQRNVDRVSHNKKMVGFNSVAERKTFVDTITATPGPTEYCIFSETDFYYGKAVPFATTPRFMKIGDETPGPGDYIINEPITTHNARLKASVLKAKLKLSLVHPRENKKAKFQPGESKALRWFHAKCYQHCV